MKFLSRKQFWEIGCAAIVVLALLLVILIKKDSREIAKPPVAEDPVELSEDVSITQTLEAGNEGSVASSHSQSTEQFSLKQIMRRDSDGLIVKSHPEGHESLHLNGRFTHVSAAVLDENEEIQIQCFTEYEALKGALEGTAPATVSRSSHNNGVSY